MAEEQKVIKIHPTFDQCGNAHYQMYSTRKDSDIIQQCIVYPERVIPVFFIPGVMGSNLRSNRGSEGKSIWRLDSDKRIASDWFGVNATIRKQMLDPDETTVDVNGKVDNKEELFLLKSRRERGWGSVSYMSYGAFLNWLQDSLNDFDQYQSGDRFGLLSSALETETGDVSLEKNEVDLTYRYLFPVFAVGYNWLKSNADSAQKLSDKVDEIISFYQKKGRLCEKVILITHSMGGLVARHYTQNLGGERKVLGVVHGVMPALGAAATYRRMKAGTENGTDDVMGWVAAQVLGGDAKSMTAVLSQSPGPLQLLPGREYGRHWLKIIDGRTTFSLPKEDPYSEIYLQRDTWWGLCEKQFINPDKSFTVKEWNKDWTEFSTVIKDKVKPFIDNLAGKYHPCTYAFYSADKAYRSYGDVCWQAKVPHLDEWLNRDRQRDSLNGRALDKAESLDTRSVSASLSGRGWTKGIHQTYRLLPPEEAGDGTVPERSGRIAGHHLQARFQVSVSHEPAFKDEQAQQFTLRALMKIIQQIQHTSLRYV